MTRVATLSITSSSPSWASSSSPLLIFLNKVRIRLRGGDVMTDKDFSWLAWVVWGNIMVCMVQIMGCYTHWTVMPGINIVLQHNPSLGPPAWHHNTVIRVTSNHWDQSWLGVREERRVENKNITTTTNTTNNNTALQSMGSSTGLPGARSDYLAIFILNSQPHTAQWFRSKLRQYGNWINKGRNMNFHYLLCFL